MEKEKRTLKFSEIFGFGAGGMFTYGFQLMITGYYLLYYMTDIAGFSTVLAASLYSTIQIIKMVTMLFSGVIIDAINFRSGKYRTWVLVSGIGLGLFFPLSFFYYPLPQSVYVVVFMIIYTLQTLFYNIGYPILGIALWAGTKQAYGCASAIYGLTIILGAIYMFCAFGKYEHQADEAVPVKKQRTGFFEMFKALKGPMVPFFCSYSFSAASVGFFMTLLVYYTTYVLNDPAAAAKSLSWNAIVGLIGCLITPWLTKRLSKKAIHVGGMILSAVGYVALALFGSKALPFIAIRAAINLVGCPSTCVMSALCNDIGDNIEMQGKEAPRAFLQGLAGATTRVGLILSSSISAFSMAAIGYVPGMEFTPELIQKMVILIAVIPAVVCAIAGACMIFYRLDEKQIAEYNAKKYGSVQ